MIQTALAQEGVEEVVVTGSFIERPADRPQPVTVLTGEEIELQQRQSIAEVFKEMPQVQATSAILNYGENYTSPTMTVNLRGLGPRATLVLMNGRRQTVDGNTGTDGIVAVDINNLAPSIMIDRVEVLTDGASALYGSDAVAGVVNVLTRNNFEGIELKTEMQSIAEIGSADFTVGALFGSASDETSVVAGFEWSHQERMNSEDRYSDERLQLGLPTSFGNPGTFWPVAGGPPIPDPLCGDQSLAEGISAGFFIETSGACQQQLSLGRAITPEVEQLNGLAVATHDFGGGLTAQVEIGFARSRYNLDFGYGLPVLPPNPLVPSHNPGVAAATADDPTWCGAAADPETGCIQDYGIWSRAFSPAIDPPVNVTQEQDTFRVAGGLSGDFGDSGWGWTTTVTFSQNESYSIGGDTIRERYNAALMGLGGPNCDAATGVPGEGDCHYFNPFANRAFAQPGDPHYNDPAVDISNWAFARSQADGRAELETIDFVVTGEIGEMAGGPTGIAVGVQNRSQEFFRDFNAISEDGGFAFNTTPSQDFGGVRDTDALFAELVMYPSETIEIQLAARYEDYGEVDSTDPKIGFLWTPTDRLFFRATAGTSFRQPGEVQSFGAINQGSTTMPIGGETINARGQLVGNLDLKPETSENYTIGMTWDITDQFTMDLNYFNIDFNDLIVSEDGQVVLTQDIADGFIDDPRVNLLGGAPNEVCEVTGRWDPDSGDPLPDDCVNGNDIRNFVLSYINQEFQRTAGIDFNFDWRFSGAGSDWGINLNGTYVDTFELTSEGEFFDARGSYNGTNFAFPNAELLANLRLDWMRGDHHARVTLRHTSALTEDDPARTLTEETDFNMIDLLYDYTLPSGRSHLTFGVLNATDEEDPIRHRDLRTVTSYVYELRGRMYRVGFDWGF